jgi:hypothetical protein
VKTPYETPMLERLFCKPFWGPLLGGIVGAALGAGLILVLWAGIFLVVNP